MHFAKLLQWLWPAFTEMPGGTARNSAIMAWEPLPRRTQIAGTGVFTNSVAFQICMVPAALHHTLTRTLETTDTH